MNDDDFALIRKRMLTLREGTGDMTLDGGCQVARRFVRRRVLDTGQLNDNYDRACRTAYGMMMSSAQVEVLRQLVTRGPVYDGDVASKAARDDLLQMGIASRACVGDAPVTVVGEQGYTVATYRGWDVLKSVETAK